MFETQNGSSTKDRFSVVIPVYNHERKVADVVYRTLVLDLPVVVVDDGSTDTTYDRIKDIAGIRILRHRSNRGKGAALMTGFWQAEKTSDWVITLDADGQRSLYALRTFPARCGRPARPPGCRGFGCGDSSRQTADRYRQPSGNAGGRSTMDEPIWP